MKVDTNFDSQIDEDNMSRDKLYRYSNFLRWSFLFSILKIVNYVNFTSVFEVTLSLFLLSCLAGAYNISMIRQTKVYQQDDNFKLRAILEVYLLLFTIMKIHIIPNYSIEYLIYFLVEEFYYNFALNVTLKQSLMFYSLHSLVMLMSYGSQDSWFIKRFVSVAL